MLDSTKKTDFECVASDTFTIAKRILENDKLCKLIYYNHEDALKQPALNQEQKAQMFKELITKTPHLPTLEEQRTAIMIMFDHFSMNQTNPHYMDCVLQFDILCHKDLWVVNDKTNSMSLRPYLIAHELYSMFHDKKLIGIGNAHFGASELLILGSNSEYSGISMSFFCINPGA